MKKLLFAVAFVAANACVLAQDAVPPELNGAASDPAVQQQFDQPDGAAIKLNPDGSFQILARGTGTYDMDDVDEVNEARQAAVLKAKAALAKFMKEKLSTEEGLAEASKKVKSATKDGDKTTTKMSKESVKTTSTVIKNKADALLKGVIVIKMQQIARKSDSGEIQATVGVSSKTLAAVEKMVKGIDQTAEQGDYRNGGQGGNGGAAAGGSAGHGVNKNVTQTSDSDF